MSVSRSIVVYKDSEDKIVELSGRKLIGCAGPAADRVHFCEYIDKNVKLYELRAGIPLSTHATAEFTRNQLAEALRKGPYQCNLLIGGFDKVVGGSLYFIDYLACLHRVSFGAHGYASYFALSMFDRFYVRDMNLEEGKEVIRKIIQELRLRFLLKIGNITVKVADANGVRQINLFD